MKNAACIKPTKYNYCSYNQSEIVGLLAPSEWMPMKQEADKKRIAWKYAYTMINLVLRWQEAMQETFRT